MVKIEKYDDTKVTMEFIGSGEHLLRVQKALLVGIEKIGICDMAGHEDHREAIWILSDVLRGFLLDESKTNVGLGDTFTREMGKKENGSKMKMLFLIIPSVAAIDSIAQEQVGKVLFHPFHGRHCIKNSGGHYNAFIDDKIACRLNNNRFSIHEVKPGIHKFSIQFSGKE